MENESSTDRPRRLPDLSILVEKTINSLSPIQRIMKMTEPGNIINMGISPDEVISFGGGWCNHETPEELRSIYVELCSDREKFHSSGRYSAIKGNMAIRQNICDLEREIFSMNNIAPTNIVVGQSSTQLFYDLMKVICDPGDGIALLDPTYANYVNSIRCALPGSRMHFIPALDKQSWTYMDDVDISLESLKELCTREKVKCLVIPNPDNPTSQMIPDEFLVRAREILLDHDAYLVMDHAYKTQYFGDMPDSFSHSPNEFPNQVNILSNSKWLSSLGRRLGWVEATRSVAEGMEKVAEVSLLSPDTLHSQATARYIEKGLADGSLLNYIEKTRALYQETANVCVRAIKKNVPFPFLVPQGGLYTCINVGQDSVYFVEELLKATGVLFIPGNGFGPSMNDAVRVSYGPLCQDHESIWHGMERVGEYLGR